jgi:hypothetical protein
MASLVNGMVTFHTNDDDKDKEINVTIEVRDNEGELAAQISDTFGQFPDHTNNGPFYLQVLNREDKSKLEGGTVLIRADTQGDQAWNFNFLLELHFDDSSTLSASANGLRLNENESQTQTFGIG